MQTDLDKTTFIAENEEASVNIRQVLERYLRFWPWFVLSSAAALTIAFLILRYTTPIYESKATILFHRSEEKAIEGLSVLSQLGLGEQNKKLANEMMLMKTPAVLNRVVKELQLNVTYGIVGRRSGKIREASQQALPFKVVFMSPDSVVNEQEGEFKLEWLSNERFELTMNETEYLGVYAFNTPVATSIGTLKFKRTRLMRSTNKNQTYIISIRPLKEVIQFFQGALQIEMEDEKTMSSDVVNLSIQGPLIDKNNEILDALIRAHREEKIYDDNEIAAKTSTFINERMGILAEELGDVEKDAESFKQEHNLVDVLADGQSFVGKRDAIEAELLKTGVQYNLVQFLQEFLKNQENRYALLPANLGFEDVALVEITAQYNKLLLDRQRLLKTSRASNPQLGRIEEQLEGLRASLIGGVNANLSRLKITLDKFNKVNNQYQDKISNIPAYERTYRDIDRQQKIKETLYIFLLQKREENEIKTAAAVGNTKIIIEPNSTGIPISPKSSVYYLAALLLGLTLPIAVIYGRTLLDTKVHSLQDLAKFKIPALGEIPKGNDQERAIVATKNARTHIAEAFRMVRTNLAYMLEQEQGGNKTLMVTSSISGEGKTFISINIGHSLAHSDKKTLVIGLDLRAPKISRYLDLTKTVGVTNYIVSPELSFDELVIHDSGNPNLDYIISGDIPPNPSELLLRPRLTELINEAKRRYDYVVIDSAPLGLVSDALHVNQLADLVVYVARAEYLDRRMLSIPAGLYHDKKIPNMAVLVNATDLMGKGYGYGYGYGSGYGYGYGQQYGYGYGSEYFDQPKKKKTKFQNFLQKAFPFVRVFGMRFGKKK
jgi:capsular exopolysaccharide synthesis family protein